MKGRCRRIVTCCQLSTVNGQLARIRKQRLVADDQRRVVVRQHRFEIGTVWLEPRLNMERARAQDARERHRRPGARIERDRPDLRHRPGGVEHDGRHRPARRDGDVGNDCIAPAEVLNRRNEADVDLAVVQQLGAFRRHVEAKGKPGCAIQTEHVRAGIQVPDGPEADTRHRSSNSKRPLRSTGWRPAARMFRRISSSGARRGPSERSSAADTPSTSSAPTVSATCASFGP